MGRTCKAVSDELYRKACQSLKKLGKTNDLGRRLQAIISVKHHGITSVAKIFGITRATLAKWVKRFKNESIAGLKIKPGRGRKRSINNDQEEIIRSLIDLNPQITIDQLTIRLRNDYQMTLGRTTVYRIMKRLNFAYITPRPHHYKSDPKKQEEFKKN